jgi:hypothetical protein
MSILDKLIGMGLAEDLTESSWWTDAVFRGLAEEEFDPQDAASAVAAEAHEQAAGSL